MNRKIKFKDIIWSAILYIIIHFITFVAATLFVADNFLQSEEGIKSILFGAFLMLMMVRYLFVEISSIKIVKVEEEELMTSKIKLFKRDE